MRVTRTETNIAYRRADHERWQQMDFVLGQRIQLSKNHPKKDICDTLQGDYPVEFVFDGWHPQCYSDDSEVLTADGWKLFADVQDNDYILSLNPDTRDIEYVGIIDRQRYERKGEMIRFYNRSLDCLVTPEHQMVYLNKADGRIERCRADEFRNTKGAFYRGCLYGDKMERASIKIGSDEIAFDDYCEFMGYWLADGSLERNSGVAVAQKKGQLLRSDIADCIARMGYIPRFRKHTIMFYNSDFNAFLKRFGHARDKYIPSDIMNASKRQISIFLNAFIQCDGSVRRCKSFIGSRGDLFYSAKQERVYFTTSPIMAANIGELLLKIGKRPSYNLQKASVSVKKDGTKIKGNYDCWRISECGSVTATVFKKETMPYDGYVYDISLERNHIMYIRRNGKCFWGSNCFCFVTPILIDEDEMAKVNEAFLKGEIYTPKGKRITDYPQAFKDWVKDNADNIAAARDRGTEPYFIRNNASVIDEILNPKPKELTTLEKAKLRHDARTPEQIADIKARAAARQKKHALMRKTADNVLKVASDYGEVDYAKLQKFISDGNLDAMLSEARIVAKQVSAIKKQEMALSDLIPDIHGWHKQFSMAELQSAYDAIKNKLAKFSALTLEEQAKKLQFEIAYVADPAKYKAGAIQYPTWKVSQSAYIKELASVNYKIDYKAQGEIIADVKKWSSAHPKSQKVASLLAEAENEYAKQSDMAVLKSKVAAAKAEMDKRIAEQARRDAKKAAISKTSAVSFGDECFTKERKDKAKYFRRENEANDYFHDNAVETWAKASKEERDAVHRYTVGSAYMTEPLRAAPGYYHYYTSRVSRFKSDCKAMTDYISRSSFKHDVWIKRDDNSGIVGHTFGLDLDAYKSHPQDLVGMVGTDKSFMSCGSNKATRFTGTGVRKDVIYNLYCPKGTKATYAEPFNNYGQFGRSWDGQSKCTYLNENEIFLQRGTTMRITKAEYDPVSDMWYIDVDVIAQEAREIEDIIITSNGFYAKLK